MKENKGSVFQQWHSAILPNYTMILHSLISLLNRLPRSAFFITQQDIDDLTLLAAAFDVEIEGNLRDRQVFNHYLGVLKKKAKEAAEKELRPGNPVEEVIDNIPQEWKDLNWNPKNLKKKLIGDEDGEE